MRISHLVLVLLIAAALCVIPAAANVGGDTATIYVTSSPSGASVYDAGVYEGTTPCYITVYTTGTPVSHDITVSKSGYYDYHQYVGDVTTGEYITVDAYLTPIVQNGYLDISSSPSGANAYVDGNYKGTTPLTVSADSGTHSVRLEKPGYNTFYGTYSVSNGQTTYVSATLGSAVSYGYINVQSYPSGANIYVDGNYYDTTPAVITVTSGTSHNVKLVLSGYNVYTQTISVGAGSTAYMNVNLVSSSDAYLRITSTPAGAAVYVDGTYMGNTAYSSGSSVSYLNVGPLSSGTHSIMLKKDGYNTYTSSVTLSPNEVRTLSITLVQSSPTPSGNAALSMDSTPSGAEVYVDNVFRGYTPLYLSDIPEGRHTLLLQLSGYNDWTEYVNFVAGQTVTMDVPLTTAVVPTPSQSSFPILAFAGVIGLAAVLVLRRTN
ncbi:hypothetical protein McpSp1_02810 [Methanocorpusculaceae archaeon Sp1]|nr:hypothetical protein [Methanocorpusculaceae archaeon Sp1]